MTGKKFVENSNDSHIPLKTRKGVSIVQWLVVTSWLASTALLGAALFSTPYMKAVVKGDAVESFAASLAGFIFGSAICAWPWIATYSNARAPQGKSRAIGFSLVAVLIAAYSYPSILSAPAEGVGFNLIGAVLLIWVAYPLSRVVGP